MSYNITKIEIRSEEKSDLLLFNISNPTWQRNLDSFVTNTENTFSDWDVVLPTMDRTCGKSGSFKDSTKTLLLKKSKSVSWNLEDT